MQWKKATQFMILMIILLAGWRSQAEIGQYLTLSQTLVESWQQQFDEQNAQQNHQRYWQVETDQRLIRQRADRSDQFCEPLAYNKLPEKLRSMAKAQGLRPQAFDELSLSIEWNQYFGGRPLWVCESVTWHEGVEQHHYWHHHLFTTERQTAQILWTVETVWR